MTAVTVGFSTTSSWLSAAIRGITRSTVSHAWFGFSLYGVALVLQADHRGVVLVARERFEKTNRVCREFELLHDFAPWIDEMLEELGTRYDYLGLLGNLWVLLGAAFGRAWANPWQRQGQWYCSEYVAYFLRESGEHILVDPSSVSPHLLLRLLEQSLYAKELDADRAA